MYIGLSQVLAFGILWACFHFHSQRQKQSIWMGKTFYMLVCKEKNIQVGTHEAQLSGGAGYLFSQKGEEYIALSVYLEKNEGEQARDNVNAYGKEAELLVLPIERLIFKGKAEEKKAKLCQEALNSLYGCMQVLSKEIARLDNGATQQSSRRILDILSRQFSYLAKTYEESYPSFSSVCTKADAFLQECMNNIIYTKELRYLLCSLSDDYLQLAFVYFV